MIDPGQAAHKLLMRIKTLFLRNRAGVELQNELQFHLDQQIAENLAAGMNLEEARRAALRTFGNPTNLRDQARETWSWGWLEILFRDLRHGVRTLARTPGFSILAILVMGLGIGANVALFTVVHSVLLKPLPFPDQDHLVRIYEADARGRFQDNIVAGGSFAAWQSQAKSFAQIAIMEGRNYNLSGAGQQLPEVILAQDASWNLFSTLGVRPALGRVFTDADDRPEASATAVLTWGFWKRRYGGDPAVLGKTVLLDARAYTVIGILPDWFTYPDNAVEVWTPIRHERSRDLMEMYTAHNFDVIGRLKPGVTPQQANAELNSIQSAIRLQHPDGPINDAVNIRPILDADVHQLKTGLYTLLAATGCLLLIACLNIANLLVARAATRRRETAIRTALGGSRSRLIREQVIESLALCVAGGSLGILLASAALQWLIHTRSDIPRADSIHIDSTVVLFATGIVLLCGLLAGLIPALSTNDRQILKTLHESSRSYSGGQAGVRLRRILLSLQVGLTVVLLIGAGLLIESYHRLLSVDVGCATTNVLTLHLNLPKGTYKTPQQFVNFYEQLLAKVGAIPGVQAVGITSALPGEGRRRDDTYTILEHPPLPKGTILDATTRFVDPGYFAAMKIPLIEGRVFRSNERYDQANSAIITRKLALEIFPGESPLGKHVVGGPLDEERNYEIIGVVADTVDKASSEISPAIYYPLYLGEQRSAALAVRAAQDAESLAIPIQKTIASIDPDLPVANILTMNQLLGQSTLDASFNATLLFAFAVLSLILAAVGLFGVLSYMVAQRTTEIGIRIALGAQREQVLRLMLRDGVRPAIFGLIVGLIASAGLTRLIRNMLYGTTALDPAVLFVVSATLLLVATIACAIPAWRASRLDPITALRME
jgi:predicted permease